MSNILGIKTSSAITPIEPGEYDATLQAVIQLGVHPQEYNNQSQPPKNMISLLFQIPSLKDGNGNIRSISKKMKATMNERSNFYLFFKAMGVFKDCSNSEVERVFGTKESLASVLGAPLQLNIEKFENSEGNKTTYVKSATKLDPRLPQPEPAERMFIFTFSEPDIDVFKNDVTKYTRSTIMEALNAKELPKEFHEFYMNEAEATSNKPSGSVRTDVI